MDTISNLRSFISVARHASFSAAARELSLSPAMVSKHIRQLEERLEVRLMHRNTRGVSLTEPGEVYCERAIDILSRLDEAEDIVRSSIGRAAGELRISCPPSFGTHVLTATLASFMEDYPRIAVELELRDDEPNLVGSRLDLVIHLGEVHDSSLVARRIGDAPFVLCAAADRRRRFSDPFRLEELARANCLIDTSVQPNARWPFQVGGRAVEVDVLGNFRSPSTEAVLEAAVDGIGLAYVPCYAAEDDLAAGRLVALEGDFECASLPIWVMYLSRSQVPAKTRAFIEHLAETMEERETTRAVAV